MSDVLIRKLEDGVLTLTLNRPERLNALDATLIERLTAEVGLAAADPAVAVVVLTGMGRGFCSGGDVHANVDRAVPKGQSAHEAFEARFQYLRNGAEASRLLHEMPKPTLAMIRGPAVGAGLGLAAACDLRIASETASFGTAFVGMGYSGDYGISCFLTHLLGPAKALELLFLGERFGAAEALRLGFVNRVVADDELEPQTMQLARRLASGPRVAYRYMKENIDAALHLPIAKAFDVEARHQTLTGMTEDHREAVLAFVQKRQPKFSGR